MATDTLRKVSAEYEAYALQTSLMKGELDWRSGMRDAEKKGRKEANLENTQKMKTMGFLTEQIQAVTGLSAETIAQL
ncbi:hypothetical protein R84B8_02786 [Treponema sp. R8-4-B8]